MSKKVILFLVYLVICLILAVVVSSAWTNAYSECSDFVYRNGICFGDSQKEVIEKEEDGFVIYDSETILSPTMTLSGIRGSSLNYYFSKGKLYQIFIAYRIGNDQDNLSLVSVYNTIEDGLIKKYGEASTTSDFVKYRNHLFDPDYMAKRTYVYGSQRFITYEDYIVVIEHALYKTGDNLRHLLLYSCHLLNMASDDLILDDL